MKNKLGTLVILFTANNILYTLTTLNGKVLFWTSMGSIKTRGLKKMTSTSVSGITKSIIKSILDLGYRYIYIKIKGFNKNKKLVIKCLNQSALTISLISEETSYPHNGCKRTKYRRI